MTPGITDFLDPLRHKLIHADVGGGLEIGANNPGLLGYAEKTTDQTLTAAALISELSVTVTVPAARRIRIKVHLGVKGESATATWSVCTIYEDGIAIRDSAGSHDTAGQNNAYYTHETSTIRTPTAGTHTYTVHLAASNYNVTAYGVSGSGLRRAYISVEDVTGVAIPAPPVSVPVGLLAQTSGGNLAAATASTTDVDLGVSLNIVVPAGRTLEVYARMRVNGAAIGDIIRFRIKMDGTTIGDSSYWQDAGWGTTVPSVTALVSPAAGSHTFTLTFHRETGTGTTTNQGIAMFFVKDITPTPVSTDQQPSSTLGYTENGSLNQSITSAAGKVDLTGLSITVSIPAGRRIRITGWAYVNQNTVDARSAMYIFEDSTQLQGGFTHHPSVSVNTTIKAEVIETPVAGTHTYKLQGAANAGTSTFGGAVDHPAFILVEDITGVSTSAHYHGHEVAPSSTLGYAQVVDIQTGIIAETDILGLSVTVTVAAGRRLKVTWHSNVDSSVAGDVSQVKIQQDGVDIQRIKVFHGVSNANDQQGAVVIAQASPAAGSHTYKVRMSRDFGTGTHRHVATATSPGFLLVEDVTGVSTALPVPTGFWAPGNEFPSNPGHGDVFYQRSTDKLWAWNGSVWTLIPNHIVRGTTNSLAGVAPTNYLTVQYWTQGGTTVFTYVTGGTVVNYPQPFPTSVITCILTSGDQQVIIPTLVMASNTLSSFKVKIFDAAGVEVSAGGGYRINWLAFGN